MIHISPVVITSLTLSAGPISVYLAKVDNAATAQANSNLKWFKVCYIIIFRRRNMGQAPSSQKEVTLTATRLPTMVLTAVSGLSTR